MSSDSDHLDSPERTKAVEVKETKKDELNEAKKEDRLTWMYKKPSELIDREEYLLGKAIDKSFEVLNSTGDLGGKTDLSNVPPRILSKTDSKEQVDIAKKIHEDPLYAIKQKEIEARKKLLNNPVLLKQIKKTLQERNERMMKKEKKKKSKRADLDQLILKKLKKLNQKEKKKTLKNIDDSESESESESESASASESESVSSNEDKKRRKKKKKSANKKLRRKKESSEDSQSSESSEDDSKKSKKKSKDTKKSNSSKKEKSDSGEDDRNDLKEFNGRRRDFKNNNAYQNSNDRFRNDSRYNNDRFNDGSRRRERYGDFRQQYRPERRNWSPSRSWESRRNNFDNQRRDRQMNRNNFDSEKRHGEKNNYSDTRLEKRKRSRSRSTDNKRSIGRNAERDKSDGKNRSQSDFKDKKKDDEKKRKVENSSKNYKTKKEDSTTSDDDDERPKSKKSYGLMMPDGSKPKNTDKNYESVPRYEKKGPEKPKYVRQEPKPVTEDEREKMLREMMENAKWRKEDREKNLFRHRKAQKRDEKIEDYDENFLRKQLSIAAGHGSMADRIKSNINNIQRSSRAMDTSFMKK